MLSSFFAAVVCLIVLSSCLSVDMFWFFVLVPLMFVFVFVFLFIFASFRRAVDPRILRERVREREAKVAAKELKVRRNHVGHIRSHLMIT